jgi:hypothetical protein
MSAVWTVRDSDGRLIPDLVFSTRLELGRKVVPKHYDAFRLHVSSSYRELFERAVAQVLQREGWEIVRLKARRKVETRADASCH